MDIADWRKKIDELDGRLVELLNERARAAREIAGTPSPNAHLRAHPGRDEKYPEGRNCRGATRISRYGIGSEGLNATFSSGIAVFAKFTVNQKCRRRMELVLIAQN